MVARTLRSLARALAAVFARAGRRLYQVYARPLSLMEEVRDSPDASAPAVLVAAAFTLQTLVAASLLKGLEFSAGGESVNLLAHFYSNLATYVTLRGVSLFAVWFILFIMYWFIMYMLGSRVEGFTVFSAVGYTLSCQLLTFAAILAIYLAAASLTPTITLAGVRGCYPRYISLAAFKYRLDVESTHLGIPVEGLVDGFEYFGFTWSVLLTVLMFRVIGELSWKRALGGGVAASVAAWFIASVFRAAGLL